MSKSIHSYHKPNGSFDKDSLKPLWVSPQAYLGLDNVASMYFTQFKSRFQSSPVAASRSGVARSGRTPRSSCSCCAASCSSADSSAEEPWYAQTCNGLASSGSNRKIDKLCAITRC